jgi:hypothetical protein
MRFSKPCEQASSKERICCLRITIAPRLLSTADAELSAPFTCGVNRLSVSRWHLRVGAALTFFLRNRRSQSSRIELSVSKTKLGVPTLTVICHGEHPARA